MAFCKKCGAEVEQDFTFCNVCGSAITKQVYTSMPTYYSPYAVPAPSSKENPTWAATTSLVLGIIGVTICYWAFIPALLALIFGIIGLKSTQRGLSIAGIVLGIIGMLTCIVVIIIYAYLMFFVSQSSPTSDSYYAIIRSLL